MKSLTCLCHSQIKDASPESWRQLDLLDSHTQPDLTSECPSETLTATMSEKDITAGFAKKINIRRFNRTYIETASTGINGGTPPSTGLRRQLVLFYLWSLFKTFVTLSY